MSDQEDVKEMISGYVCSIMQNIQNKVETDILLYGQAIIKVDVDGTITHTDPQRYIKDE